MASPITPITSGPIFSQSPGSVTPSIDTIYGKIMVLLGIIAGGAVLIYLVWGGIKYMQAGADTKKAAAARSMIITAVVGAALIIGVLTIFTLGKSLGTLFSGLANGGGPITFTTSNGSGTGTSSTSSVSDDQSNSCPPGTHAVQDSSGHTSCIPDNSTSSTSSTSSDSSTNIVFTNQTTN